LSISQNAQSNNGLQRTRASASPSGSVVCALVADTWRWMLRFLYNN